MAKVSVIVPVYKVEKYIHRCLDSILGQTFADFELILVDDGSPDNCGSICDEYAAKDSRVVVIHQENGGLSAARNAGLDWVFENSNSKWLSFVDSDDWVHPQYLELLVSTAENHNVQLAACQEYLTNNQIVEFSTYTGIEDYALNAETFYCDETTGCPIVSAWVKLFERMLFDGMRFPVGMVCEDLFLTPRLLFECDKIAIVPARLYIYYQSADSITRAQWTPRRLDQIIHYADLCVYFRKIRERESFEVSVSRMFACIIGQLYQIQEIGKTEYEVYFEQLCRKAQFLILRYPRLIDFPFHQNRWSYEMIFPNLMKIYWKCKQIEGKFKR